MPNIGMTNFMWHELHKALSLAQRQHSIATLQFYDVIYEVHFDTVKEIAS